MVQRTALSLAVLVAISLQDAAIAQSVPKTQGKTQGDPLMEICSGFLDQNSLSISGDAQRLCTCLVREVKGKLSKAEMEVYDRRNQAGQPLPDALQNKITGIAVQCLTEAR